MNLSLQNKPLAKIQAAIELTFIYCKKVQDTEDATLLNTMGYEAKHGSTLLLPEKGRLYLGIEKKDVENLQVAAFNVIKALKGYTYTSIKCDMNLSKAKNFKAFCEGLLLGAYDFTKYKSKQETLSLQEVIFSTHDETFQTALDEAVIFAQATNYTRDIVNTTPEDMYPLEMAKTASNLAKEYGLGCTIIDESQLLEENMEAMYMVGRASVHKSQLIHLSYVPKNPKHTISLIGKGLTYDSGGLSLKPADSMVTMKLDKSGGSAVLGIMKAVAELKLPVEVHAFVGAVENMVGGDAYKPDDVLKARNGVTVEVRNTDAEGRLVLADVLCYAQDKVKADYIFDYATLTGACVVALGLYTTGIMGHNSKLKHTIIKANDDSGELSSTLPFNDHLKEELDSKVADIKNVTGRWGGAITAGLFLDNFIKEENKEKWVHFDIAGPAFTEKPWGVHTYGGTGAGVRLTLAWMQNLLSTSK